MIDYSALEHSEIGALLEQKIGKIPKVKSKQIKSNNNIKI